MENQQKMYFSQKDFNWLLTMIGTSHFDFVQQNLMNLILREKFCEESASAPQKYRCRFPKKYADSADADWSAHH